jgi:hypothetical protein
MLLPFALLLAGAALTPVDSTHCVSAATFLRTDRRMIAEIEGDTVSDWRTGKRLAGCRITAAGATEIGVPKEAARLYDRLRAAGFSRTPDPRDSPNEGSLRFRMGPSDCLFNVNSEAMLFTDAESRVNDKLVVPGNTTRYQVFVMCLPALPAKP